MNLLQKDLEKIETIRGKTKELINDQTTKILSDIELDAVRITSHQSASSDNIEKAITAGRGARDRILEAKSNAIIKIDNIVKNTQANQDNH